MTFKKTLIIAGLIALPLAFSAQAQPADSILEMSAKSLPVQGGNTYVLVTITNRGTQILDQINFKCVFTFSGDPVSVVTGYVQRLAPGKTDTVQVYANYQTPSDGYTCRATQALIYF